MKVKLPQLKIIYQNKFILSLAVFVLWLTFFDSNSLIDRWEWIKEVNQLKADRNYYLNRIENDNARLKELRTNKSNLEKFAREQYFMKKKKEDIFVIVEK